MMNIEQVNTLFKVVKERNKIRAQIKEYENWFIGYDKKVLEHLRCERLGIVCIHNIIELDILAESKKAEVNLLKAKLTNTK